MATRERLQRLVDGLSDDQAAVVIVLLESHLSGEGQANALPGFFGMLHLGKGDLAARSEREGPLAPSSSSNLIIMERPLGDDDVLRQHATLLRVLAEEHGLMDLALGDSQAEIIATVAAGRTYFDIARFELAAANLLGVVVHVTPSSAPGAHVRAPLAAAA